MNLFYKNDGNDFIIERSKDSVGGILTCVVRNLPIGLGEPVFDRLEAKLAQAMLSIPATKGFEIGSGFKGTEMIIRNIMIYLN